MKGRKLLADVLIAVLSLALLSANSQLSKAPKGNIPYLFGQFSGVLLLIAFFIFSVKWRITLSGYQHSSGRQAISVFLIFFCSWGLMLTLYLMVAFAPTSLMLVPIVMTILYAGGLYLCLRWLKKLRNQDPPVAMTQTGG